MIQFKLLLLLSTCASSVFSKIDSGYKKLSISRNNLFQNPAESYIGPSSYTTSFQSTNSQDYPAFGNFGYLLNTQNPQYTSSYTSFGPSENSEFGSTSYINYPSSTSLQTVVQPDNKSPIFSEYSSVTSHDSTPTHNSEFPQALSSLINTPQSNEGVPISQHIEVTRPVVVPVYKKFPYAVSKHFPVAIPHPVLVPVPAPYPVNVLISEPVAVPIIKEIRVPVEKEVMYPVEKNVPVEVEKPVQFNVEKHYPVYVPKPYPVKIPIIKTIIHKSPKKWSREQKEEEIRRYAKTMKSLNQKSISNVKKN